LGPISVPCSPPFVTYVLFPRPPFSPLGSLHGRCYLCCERDHATPSFETGFLAATSVRINTQNGACTILFWASTCPPVAVWQCNCHPCMLLPEFRAPLRPFFPLPGRSFVRSAFFPSTFWNPMFHGPRPVLFPGPATPLYSWSPATHDATASPFWKTVFFSSPSRCSFLPPSAPASNLVHGRPPIAVRLCDSTITPGPHTQLFRFPPCPSTSLCFRPLPCRYLNTFLRVFSRPLCNSG